MFKSFGSTTSPHSFLQPKTSIQHAVVISSKVTLPSTGLDDFIRTNIQVRFFLADDINKQLKVLEQFNVPVSVILATGQEKPANVTGKIVFTNAEKASVAVIQSTIASHNQERLAQNIAGMASQR